MQVPASTRGRRPGVGSRDIPLRKVLTMVTRTLAFAATVMLAAACSSSSGADTDAESTPQLRTPPATTDAETQALDGVLCSEAGVPSDEPPPEDSEGFDGIATYVVEQPVDDTLLVDGGAACVIASTVSGDVVVAEGGRAIAVVNPGGVVRGDLVATGTGRGAGLEDREDTSAELGEPLVEGDLICDQCGVVFATAGSIQGNVTVDGTPSGGQTELNGATFGGDVSIIDSSGGGQLDDEPTGPLLANSDVAGSVTISGSFGRSPVLDGTTIGGDLTCEDNSPEPIGTGVTVDGTASGQCEGIGG